MSLIERPVLHNYLKMADNKSVPLNRLDQHENAVYTNHESHDKGRRMYSEVVSAPPVSPNNESKSDLIRSDSIPQSSDSVNAMRAVKPRKSSFQITRVVDSVDDTDGLDDIDGVRNGEGDDDDTMNDDSCDSGVNRSSGKSEHSVQSAQQFNVMVNGHASSPPDNRLANNGGKQPVASKVEAGVQSSKPLSEVSVNSPPQQVAKSPNVAASSDIQSRFKIVKIVSCVRGRWKCMDFSGHPAAETTASDSKSGRIVGSPSVLNVNGPGSYLYVAGGVNAVANPIQTLVCGAGGGLVQLGSDPNFQRISNMIVSANNLPLLNSHDMRNRTDSLSNTSLASSNIFAHGGTILPALSMTMPHGSASIPADKSVISENSATYNRTRSDPSFQTAVDCSGSLAIQGHIESPGELMSMHGSGCSTNASGGCGGSIGVVGCMNGGAGNINGAESRNVDGSVNNMAVALGESSELEDSTSGLFPLDNKIEQAMDLVKSHLMFAVHEEVEQLKVQIKELSLRNVRLEAENTILRAAALPETLAKLDTLPQTNARPDFT